MTEYSFYNGIRYRNADTTKYMQQQASCLQGCQLCCQCKNKNTIEIELSNKFILRVRLSKISLFLDGVKTLEITLMF